MAYALSQDLLKLCSSKICTTENKERAISYIGEKRKLNSANFKYVPFLTGNLSKFVSVNSSVFSKDWLSDSLYFPITSIEDNKLIGFDVRYTGNDPERTRYYKFKVENSSLFNYNSKSLFESKEVLFVYEGVIDLETLDFCLQTQNQFKSYSHISPLTCLTNFNYFKCLLCSYSHLVIVYDNDEAGQKAISRIRNWMELENINNIHFLTYLSKDINDAYKIMGQDHLFKALDRLYNEIYDN